MHASFPVTCRELHRGRQDANVRCASLARQNCHGTGKDAAAAKNLKVPDEYASPAADHSMQSSTTAGRRPDAGLFDWLEDHWTLQRPVLSNSMEARLFDRHSTGSNIYECRHKRHVDLGSVDPISGKAFPCRGFPGRTNENVVKTQVFARQTSQWHVIQMSSCAAWYHAGALTDGYPEICPNSTMHQLAWRIGTPDDDSY